MNGNTSQHCSELLGYDKALRRDYRERVVEPLTFEELVDAHEAPTSVVSTRRLEVPGPSRLEQYVNKPTWD